MASSEAPGAPSAGPGMREDLKEKAESSYGRGDVDERFADVADPLEEVPDDAEADLDSVIGDSRIQEVLDRLDRELVGLVEVKQRVREIAALLLIDRLRRTMGLESEAPTLHMSFTGNPGTGKTTVAQRMGEVLHKLGYVRKGHLVTVSRDDLVGQYVGHTAPKTREVLKRAMGGVLFIDEAYHLYRVDNERDYGQETVEMLLQVMENQRSDLVVIMAGYADRMERFFSDVPGLSSRIGHHIDFPDYKIDELMGIAQLMVGQQNYRFSSDAEKAFQDYLSRRMEQPRFANGRSVRNALDRLRMRHANRLWEAVSEAQDRKITKGDLVTIQAEDIMKSRVFEEGEDAQEDADGEESR
ncbi:MAG TPA: CbbX protein [Pseudonocardiaceae bacterium]|nr:CbbX protein [Pseudonocardiaceae bacterium]